jgi:hypothetical protein
VVVIESMTQSQQQAGAKRRVKFPVAEKIGHGAKYRPD